MDEDRIRRKSLLGKVVSSAEAALHIEDGMVVGLSGLGSGDAKVVPVAVADRAANERLRITLMTGASMNSDVDRRLTMAGAMARRMPFQADPVLRAAINRGEVMYLDQHLSDTAEMLRSQQIPPVDVAIIEAVAITEQGGIVPTTAVANAPTYALQAKKVIVELNLHHSLELEGLHDVYIPAARPDRQAVPIFSPQDRIGLPYIPVDPARIAAIVVTDQADSTCVIQPPDQETKDIAGHLVDFFANEVKQGRLGPSLAPLQAGIGSIGNDVLHGFVDSPFHDLVMYSEVLQDSTFDLFDTGKLAFASGASILLSNIGVAEFLPRIGRYRDRMILRPQEITNHPEVLRRLGVIAINTALEADIYGNVNSTHVFGTGMMNGIGGSADFSRNARIAVFITKSLAKDGRISSIVPMVSHVDHIDHDVDVLVTEQGLADLRGLAPRERARTVIDNCVHPSYRDMANDYFREAAKRGGHTPHLMEQAFGWHLAYQREGTMQAGVMVC